MKNLLSMLLLTAGTILGGLAAANSAKAWKSIPLGDASELPGEYLFEDLQVPGAAEGAGPLFARGEELTTEVVSALRSFSRTDVKVMDPPRASVSKDVAAGGADSLAGSVLVSDVVLPDAERVVEAGAPIDSALARELLEHGVETEGKVELKETEAGEVLLHATQRLRYSVPASYDAGTFIDDEVAAALIASGIESVEVKVVRGFSWNDWTWKWHFVGGVCLMLAAIFLKRSGAGAVGSSRRADSGPERCMRDLYERVSELNLRKQELDAAGLQAEVSVLLEQLVQPVIDAREELQGRLGTGRYAVVMSPFASGERKLNRAWSAAVDGHAPEARASLEASLASLREVCEVLPR